MMVEKGAVYVMVNSCYPGLFKVGRTTRPVTERLAELSGATGVPTPFVLAFEQDFADCVHAERAVHAELDRLGRRIRANREFFTGPPGDIIRIIQSCAAAEAAGGVLPSAKGVDASAARVATAARLLARGDAHLHGSGPTLQDNAEAARLYRAAAAAGSLVALDRLGSLYARHQPGSRAGRRRAMRLLKQGAAAGNYFCLTSMAALYAEDRHAANFVKLWDEYFARRDAARCDEAEAEPGCHIRACQAYIRGCLDLGLEPQHLGVMAAEAEPIMLAQLAAVEQVRDAPEARHRLVQALRWSYQTLLAFQDAALSCATQPARAPAAQDNRVTASA